MNGRWAVRFRAAVAVAGALALAACGESADSGAAAVSADTADASGNPRRRSFEPVAQLVEATLSAFV